jgi:hypothetical protein
MFGGFDGDGWVVGDGKKKGAKVGTKHIQQSTRLVVVM